MRLPRVVSGVQVESFYCLTSVGIGVASSGLGPNFNRVLAQVSESESGPVSVWDTILV